MRITRRQLRRIIKEEVSRLSEAGVMVGVHYFTDKPPRPGEYFSQSGDGYFVWDHDDKAWRSAKELPSARVPVEEEAIKKLGIDPLPPSTR